MFPTDVVIVAGARTPMARDTGAFLEGSAIDLGAVASKEAIKRSGVDAADFDHAIFGNVMQTSADALYGARHVGLKAGLKVETPAVTVNRLCGSGIEAITQAAQWILTGRRGTRRYVDGGADGFVLRIADGDDRRKIGGATGDYAERGRCVCAAVAASGGCSLQSLPDSRRAGFGGSEAGEESDYGERGRSPAAGDDDGNFGEVAAVV